MSVLLVAMTFGLAGLVVAGLVAAADSRRVLVAGLAILTAWLAAAVTLSSLEVFKSTTHRPIPVIAFGIALPIAAGALLLAKSEAFRAMVRRGPLPLLVGIQVFRVFGFVFLVAYAQSRMPAVFALPAGIGDILVGLAAPVAALVLLRGSRRAGRTAALAWSIAGIVDLVMAVTLGFLSAPSPFQQLAHGHANAAITEFPYVLVPVFAVPIAIVLHLAVLWRMRTDAPAEQRLSETGRFVPAFS